MKWSSVPAKASRFKKPSGQHSLWNQDDGSQHTSNTSYVPTTKRKFNHLFTKNGQTKPSFRHQQW